MTLQATPEGLAAFQDMRFGMFIHWGVYAMIARGEWVMHTERIPVAEYEKLAPQFNPTRFDADEWVSIAVDAGQKYIVITSRHHDGYSMYDTALSDYKITNGPFKRDPLAELANACAKRGDVKIGFYNSLLDWHHPAYRFRNESGLAWEDYIAFLHGQVRELCTNYGQIVCMWFDGDWPMHALDASNAYFASGGSFEYEKLYDMIHTLQPQAVVHNNRHAQPLPGEDVQGFEQDLPGQNTVGFNTSSVYDMPAEVCMTINNFWGEYKGDNDHKTTHHLIHTLARSASAGANYLLNVGPTAEGEILPVHIERLLGMGSWLYQNGRSIYGTRAGVIPPTRETVSTRQGDTHYVHILSNMSDVVTLKDVPESVSNARLLMNGASVPFERTADRVRLLVPEPQRNPFDTVVVLE
ncbi:MAG: alpha-L-fucosidase [Chloroflexi bacterium]|nr:alpha-L-fucosidase [Chloroflexota bacterium]